MQHPATLTQRREPTETAKRGKGSTVQRQTSLGFNPDVALGTNRITACQHARVPMNETQKSLAAQLSGYADVQHATGDCKHYVPYASVSAAVLAQLMTEVNVTAAVTWLRNLVLPPAAHFGPADGGNDVGGIPAVNIPADLAGNFVRGVLNRQVDDLIANLANDPRNLYYWPNSIGDGGGTRVDVPTGRGSPLAIADLKARLAAYRDLLVGLGLDVV